jgi:hypothetical protein
MLVMGIHNLLFATEYAVLLPHLQHQAYLGNWSEVAQAISPSYSSDAPAPDWSIMNLTILCNEDWAKIGREETIQFSAGAYTGYEDVRRLTVPEKVCPVIPLPQPDALYQPLTYSPVPVLIISKQADPQNPPENVASAKEHFPSSLGLVAPGQGHGFSGLDCRNQFVSAFIEKGTTKELNTSCLEDVPLPGFNLNK